MNFRLGGRDSCGKGSSMVSFIACICWYPAERNLIVGCSGDKSPPLWTPEIDVV